MTTSELKRLFQGQMTLALENARVEDWQQATSFARKAVTTAKLWQEEDTFEWGRATDRAITAQEVAAAVATAIERVEIEPLVWEEGRSGRQGQEPWLCLHLEGGALASIGNSQNAPVYRRAL